MPEKTAGSTLKSPTSESGSSDSSDSEEEPPAAQPQPPQAGESPGSGRDPSLPSLGFPFLPRAWKLPSLSVRVPLLDSQGEQPLLVVMIPYAFPAAKTNAVPQPTSVRKAPAPTPAPVPAPAPPPADSSDDSSEESDSDEEVVPPTQVKSCRPAGCGLSGGTAGLEAAVGWVMGGAEGNPLSAGGGFLGSTPWVSVTPSPRARFSKLAVCESGGGCECFGRNVTSCASLSLGLLCPLGPT